MLRIGFPIPTKENEHRLAMLPQDVPGTAVASELVFESGYGKVMDLDDDAYRGAGSVVADRETVCACPIVCNPKPMLSDEYFRQGTTLFGWIHAVQGREITDALVNNRMTAIAWEEMYERGRYCFERNREISGEAAITHAFLLWARVPYECRVAVIGRGMTARGALRVLERWGCNVMVYDRKTSPYLRQELEQYDVIVNCVLWDVFRDDHIIYEEDLEKMKPGSMIIDISCDAHMAIESSRPTTIEDPIYSHKGVFHYAVDHTPSLFHKTISAAISKSIVRFVHDLATGTYNPVLDKATIIRNGEVLDERIIRFQHR